MTLLQRIDSLERLSSLRAFPVVEQFPAVPVKPFEDQLLGAARHCPAHDLAGSDAKADFRVVVAGVKTRGLMLAIIHRDDDPEET
jgi:hypothetical protein